MDSEEEIKTVSYYVFAGVSQHPATPEAAVVTVHDRDDPFDLLLTGGVLEDMDQSASLLKEFIERGSALATVERTLYADGKYALGLHALHPFFH